MAPLDRSPSPPRTPDLSRIKRPRRRMLSMLPRHGVGAEIGVWKGDFARAILDVTTPDRLFLIDPWRVVEDPAYDGAWYHTVSQEQMDRIHRRVGKAFREEVAAGQVEVVREDSAVAAPRIEARALDFVYIDADHSHAGVSADLARWWPKLKAGGLMGLDDYALGHWWGDGVVRAVHEFLAAMGAEARIEMVAGNQIALRKL